MRSHFLLFFSTAGLTLAAFNANAQLPKVKVNIDKPKIEKPKIDIGTGSGTSDGKLTIPGKDPSGLFSNVTDDTNAEYHRKTAVSNLTTLETEYTKTAIDYDALTKLIFENERTLGHIIKLEPKVDATKYDERYKPLKERADKEISAYDQVKKLEELFDREFDATTEFLKPDPLTFRSDSYGAHSQCYCRNYDSEVKTLAEFETSKAEYEKLTKQLVGYSDEATLKRFENMNACVKNGNQYAIWVAKEKVASDVVAYSTANQTAEPKNVIKRCEDYLNALDRIESDFSLNLDIATKAAITEGRATINKTKTDSETYISSGKYQQYLDKVHAAEIAKVYLPKAVAKNATLEQGAFTYVKSADYNDYLKNTLGDSEVASTLRASTQTTEPYVKKNEYGLPLYQYHEIWVAYKGKDGKCYMAAVYASYTYKGGGTYAGTPTWSADAPEELACDNVSK